MLFFNLIIQILIQCLQERDPKFEAQTIDNNISIGYGLAIGDVDGDGKPDILLADKKQFAWYRNGDWKRFVMIENLTENDNVCLAARDINGDGKVEVAVGAQWNPSETSNINQSGSVHFLIAPADPTQRWKAIQLHHEPTVHRMKWILSKEGKYYLVVVPLHGRGNKAGEGEGVKVLAYEYPRIIQEKWPVHTLDDKMHLTHNFDIVEASRKGAQGLYVAGKEGIRFINNDFISKPGAEKLTGLDRSAGEVRVGTLGRNKFLATIEPMHGNELVVYTDGPVSRIVLDDDLKEGHALAVEDVLGNGTNQVVAGWRLPNKAGKVGIKMYFKKDKENKWDSYWIDDNGMACEDLQVMDLNRDGRPDIVASGRASRNLVIYWNKNQD